MNYTFLSSQNIKDEISLIKTSIDNKENCVFIYTGKERLHNYIDSLADEENGGLDNEYLYKLKICYEREKMSLVVYKWLTTPPNDNGCRPSQSDNADNSLTSCGGASFRGNDDFSENNAEVQIKSILFSLPSTSCMLKKSICSISELISELEPDYAYFIIVKNNDLEQLTFIMQQIIYIGFPQEKIELLLQKEVDTVFKTNNLIKDSSKLISNCKNAITKLNNSRISKTNEKIWEKIKSSIDDVEAIASRLERLSDNNIKIGVIATKKAGKSVFTNCLLEENISPSSTLLPTPNITVYKKSSDKKYHCNISKNNLTFDKSEDLNKFIKKQFNEAVEKNWSLEDMIVEYPSSPKYIKSNILIYDTPGPNAANAVKHKEKAYNIIEKLDVAIFIIDYSKYLTNDEAEYFIEVINKFSSDEKYRSLIILVNQVDKRFDDAKDKHSVIGFLDFFKSRIESKPVRDYLEDEKKKIFCDKFYERILLFPGSSLEYLNSVLSEKLDINGELNKSEGGSFNKLIELQKLYKKSDELLWLSKYAHDLEDLGENSFSFNAFKQDSGIPNLMEYISKVINYCSTKNNLISDLRFYVKQLENDNNIFEEDKRIIKEDIGDLNNQINNLNNSINKIKKDINDLKKLYENSFCNDSKQFTEIQTKFKFLSDFSNNYLDNLKEKINFVDIGYELYNHFFFFIWSNIKSLSDSNSNINGKLINSLIDKYDFCATAYEIFEKEVDSIREIVVDEVLCQTKQKFYKILYEYKNELEEFSYSYNTLFKKYNIDFRLDELNFEIIVFNYNYNYNINSSFCLDFSDFKLYEYIKSAFKKTFGAKLYKIVTIGYADDMEAGLSLDTDYNEFRKIFDENVKNDYYSKLSSRLVFMQSELMRIIKNDFLERNFNKMEITVDKVKDYFESLKSCFDKLKSDVADKVSEYEVKILETEKIIKNKQTEIANYSNDYDNIVKLQEELSIFVKEIKASDKVLDLPVVNDWQQPIKSILDEIKESDESGESLGMKPTESVINVQDLKEEKSLMIAKNTKVFSVKLIILLVLIIVLLFMIFNVNFL